MKKLQIVFAMVFLMSVSGCSEEVAKTEGFEVTWNKANIFFVYLHKNLRGEKSAQRRACAALCDSKGLKECEIYMWSKKKKIPDGLPIRNAGSFIHSYYKRDSAGKKKYKCLECK